MRREVDSAQGALQSLTLAFLDVDGLKAINDAHGHEAGDRSLVRVVGALRTHLRPHDLIIRFGGDEFLCSLTGLDQTEATERLHRVVSALADDALPVSITIGLASLGPHESISDLIQRADEAFYAARRRR